MNPVSIIRGVAAPFYFANVDTDVIIPQRFLKRTRTSGFGDFLFYYLRYNADGSPNSDFILNRAPYDKAQILLSGENCGSGSSREHAPWALYDFGIRALIAVSFADIFYSNCINNGLVPISLDAESVEKFAALARSEGETQFEIDLASQTIRHPGIGEMHFEFDPNDKDRLLAGRDLIDITLAHEDAIKRFEEQSSKQRPWVEIAETVS
jgi:3-isopropylmalate/(R)-2-methylmalate dehydratase small subunit